MMPRVRAVVQRVKRASVRVGPLVAGEIGTGLLVLVGVAQEDKESDAEYLARKILTLRIFDDTAGRMNLAVGEVSGAALVVSQFTLLGDARGQNRPSYIHAARPQDARRLYEHLVERLRAGGLRCETGQFQEMMEVELVNDGPVTILLDSGKAF